MSCRRTLLVTPMRKSELIKPTAAIGQTPGSPPAPHDCVLNKAEGSRSIRPARRE